MKKPGLFHKILVTLNIIAGTALLCAYLAAYISPKTLGLLAFAGLGYPAILLFNILFCFYWGIRKKKWFWFSLTIILLGWSHMLGLFQPAFPGANSGVEGTKVMSYNVRVFDLYQWTKNKQGRNAILENIRQHSPDILCLQEFFYSSVKGYFTTRDTITQLTPTQYYHTEYTKSPKGKYHFGIATFSRYPIVGKGIVEGATSGNNICIFSDLKIKEDTLRVYNMHLASVHFGKEEYALMEQLTEAEHEERVKGVKQIYKLLQKAFQLRADQADAIRAHIANAPYPVMICGDFNDTPSSYAYHTISEDLNDAFLESGSGFGQTYNGSIPGLRIDYLLHSPSVKSSNYQTVENDDSDHFAISCQIDF